MTVQEFQKFLLNIQRVDLMTEDVEELIKKHDRENNPNSDGQLLSPEGFRSFLLSGDNDIFCRQHKTIFMDMDQPLSHYFISASHNTYLMGNQLK